MRNVLLASCAFVVLVCYSKNSFSQSILGTGGASEWGQLTSWAKQVQDNARQLQQLYQQYQTLNRTYMALSHATDISSVASALGGASRTFIPQYADTFSAVGQGANLIQGAAGIRSLDQVFSMTSRIPSTMRSVEWAMQDKERNINVTSNAKQLAKSGLDDMQSRIAGLNAAQARLAVATDATELAAVSGQIQVAQANIQAHQASLAAMQLSLHASDRAERTRAEERTQEGADLWQASTRPGLDALMSEAGR